MKAIRVRQFGGPETLQLEEVPDPAPGPGEILVRLHAAGVNPVDTYIRSGKYPRLPELPYTPGGDGAGRIEALGDGTTGTVGERVYVSGSVTGTYAELCVSKARDVHPLPEPASFSQGAALGVPYGTAYRALFQRAHAARGETVLIHGGTGGVGLAAIQWAHASGLTVFATGGSAAGRELLTKAGAQAVFDHTAPGYAVAILEQSGGRGVDVILEMLANVNLGTDLELLALRGRVAIIGSRGPVEINPREAMMREANVLGVMLGAATEEEIAEIHAAIGAGLADRSLHPVVAEQFPLEQAAAAHEAVMAGGSRGKIVLVL